MDEPPSEAQLPDGNLDRGKMQLQCIGSFKAYTQDQVAHTIEIWTHFGELHDRQRRRVSATQLILTTTDGRDVDRIDQGEYRLHDSPEISLSTDDPEAP